ncbi:tRNA pseudouridine(13) synthase TruD [Candidatus Woesearchaeota archaeon]|nr:tRNA pseudouridine(13) synthase TruD [Candidatus Woesearchaeota archaeon]
MHVLKARPEDFVVEEIPSREWKDKGAYLILEVTKKERNTEDVAQLIATKLGVKRSSVAYAGLKDKHAVTTQYFSVRGKGKHAVDWLRMDGVSFKAIGFTDEPLSLGSLRGNRFAITVRNIDSLPGYRSLFPNCFDEQRFGEHNDDVGKALVRGDFSEACALIDDDRVLGFLAEHPGDHAGALRQLPKKLLTLYVHAYQSRLFNRVLELLVEERGVEALRSARIPLLGFGTEDVELYKRVMEEERISPRDFIIRSLPDISSEGGERQAVINVSDFWFGELDDDELHPGKKKVVVTFSLPKGAYATNVIKRLWSQPE